MLRHTGPTRANEVAAKYWVSRTLRDGHGYNEELAHVQTHPDLANAYLSRDARLRLRTTRLRRHEGVFIRFDNFEPGEAREIEGRNVRVVEGVTIERVTPNGS